MTTVAEVRLWGRTIGAVSQAEGVDASFVRHCIEGERNQAIVCGRLDFPNAMPTLEQLGERFA